MKKLFILTFLCCLSQLSNGQSTLSLGVPGYQDYYRMQQLLGNLDSTVSFLIRPLTLKTEQGSIFRPDGSYLNAGVNPLPFNSGPKLTLLPVITRSRYTSKHPFDWNDGSMIPASGQQQLISAGLAVDWGPLSLQLYPEFLHAENREFEGLPATESDRFWFRIYNFQRHRIDQPERFGSGAFNAFIPGQSHLTVNLGPIGFGVSTENLWWGPGQRNSLIMSNTARGFLHGTLHSNKPIRTPIGHIEFQLIGGRLDDSGFLPPQAFRSAGGRLLYVPRNDDWRYISAIVTTYQPKWTPGLSLGLSRAVQQYSERARRENNYLGAISSVFRRNDDEDLELERDQIAAFYIRYFSTRTNAEFYFEFARNDAAWNLRDLFLEPQHAAAYLIGFQKYFPFRARDNQFISMNLEWTTLQQSANRIVREAFPFYVHSQVRQGYTNRGEFLGAGIGSGSNSQTVSVDWVSGLKRAGLRIERHVHNNDLYLRLVEDIQDPRRHWVDLSASLLFNLDRGPFVFNGQISVIKSFNYQYQITNQVRTPSFFVPGKDVINYLTQLNVLYRF